jgi:hypothetical protein
MGLCDLDAGNEYAEAFRRYLRPQPDKFRCPNEFRHGHLAG